MTGLTTTEWTAEAQNEKNKSFTTWVIVIGFMLWGISIPLGLLSALGYWLGTSFEFPHSTSNALMMPGGLFAIFHSILFSIPAIYFILCIGGACLFILAFLYGMPTRVQKGLLIYLLSLIVLQMVFPYSPTVSPTEGKNMLVLTEPALLSRGLKRAQGIAGPEWCNYTLLGWQEDALFYEESCLDGRTARWMYRPSEMAHSEDITAMLDSELYVNVIPRDGISHLVDSQARLPDFSQISILYLKIKEDVLQSPNGEWAAFTAKHQYGAEDVIVINLN